MSKKMTLLGYASGIGAGNHDCSSGPNTIQKSRYFSKINDFIDQFKLFSTDESHEKLEAIPNIAQINRELAQSTANLTRSHQPFITLGGDNCSSIGTWSGVSAARSEIDPIGLIWLDAHLDSHTPSSSRSKNVHGMPLAALLGFGDERLTRIMSPSRKLFPENVCVIGARSYEDEEKALLEQLGVKIYYIEEVNKRGFHAVIHEATQIISHHSRGYGICLDLDVIDPSDAPGVGTPEKNGIKASELLAYFTSLHTDKRLLGIEIVEFNPMLDIDHKTEQLIIDLIQRYHDGSKEKS